VDAVQPRCRAALVYLLPGYSERREVRQEGGQARQHFLRRSSGKAPYSSFDEVLETKEWTPLEPGFFEKNYYVRGVGPLGNPGDLGLVDVKHR
jgi:hypothetical protein